MNACVSARARACVRVCVCVHVCLCVCALILPPPRSLRVSVSGAKEGHALPTLPMSKLFCVSTGTSTVASRAWRNACVWTMATTAPPLMPRCCPAARSLIAGEAVRGHPGRARGCGAGPPGQLLAAGQQLGMSGGAAGSMAAHALTTSHQNFPFLSHESLARHAQSLAQMHQERQLIDGEWVRQVHEDRFLLVGGMGPCSQASGLDQHGVRAVQ